MYLQQLLLIGRAVENAKPLEDDNGYKLTEILLKIPDQDKKLFKCKITNKTCVNAEKIQKGDLVMVDGTPDVEAHLTETGEITKTLLVKVQRWKVIK
jgi:ribosomal protein S4E